MDLKDYSEQYKEAFKNHTFLLELLAFVVLSDIALIYDSVGSNAKNHGMLKVLTPLPADYENEEKKMQEKNVYFKFKSIDHLPEGNNLIFPPFKPYFPSKSLANKLSVPNYEGAMKGICKEGIPSQVAADDIKQRLIEGVKPHSFESAVKTAQADIENLIASVYGVVFVEEAKEKLEKYVQKINLNFETYKSL